MRTRPGTSFLVLPALDVLEGRCVRLAGGDRKRVTVEGGDPVEAANRFVAEGASFLHLVDLDGAFSGERTAGLVERVTAAAGSAPVQVGGGYRTIAAIEGALAAGAARVMVGTAALSPGFLEDAAERFGEALVIAVDARDGLVVANGWTRSTELTAEKLARACADAGVARLLVTSASRDGSLAGPDLELLGSVIVASGLRVLAAGGIASLDDLARLREIGCEGAILGSALWSGRVTLADALRCER
ncbi:MAG TPA: 1-(5-phosphoribosyl)-5-[(5-phosphoribosylamino)methylideneamino] imidazole-4-carboxamide isomerase [Gaiellaceae bacterium]|nr:1-(5-phosphoribosyl)-5-[(5-phosphoribosylamino)methylideneamino] imidazole-4-carboxamide isomerase [Gaiellaceae bacterium]